MQEWFQALKVEKGKPRLIFCCVFLFLGLPRVAKDQFSPILCVINFFLGVKGQFRSFLVIFLPGYTVAE